MDKTQYFYRTVAFSRADNQVCLVDINNPGESTLLESWLGVVVSLADGAHTIGELITYLGGHYPGTPPSELESTLESVFQRLGEGEMIKMSDQVMTLPYYLAAPLEELDIERAKQLMQEDGYTHH